MSPKHETVAQLERRRLELKSLLASTSGAGKNLGHYNKKVDTSNAVEALNWKTELDSIEETLSRHGAMEFWQNSNSTYD